MNSFDYGTYLNAVQFITSAQEQLQQSLNHLEEEYKSSRENEEHHAQNLRLQLSQKKEACLKQYEEIRLICESLGLFVLPIQQHPIASQLFIEDAFATQNGIAKEINAQIDKHRREEQRERQAKREQQEAQAKAAAEAREKAIIAAKKREEDRIKAEKEEALRLQLEREKERQRQEELRRRLARLIPAGIIIAIVLFIMLQK